MPNARGSAGSSGENWREVDAFVQRFEQAWQMDGRPSIDDFLPADGPIRWNEGKKPLQTLAPCLFGRELSP